MKKSPRVKINPELCSQGAKRYKFVFPGGDRLRNSRAAPATSNRDTGSDLRDQKNWTANQRNQPFLEERVDLDFKVKINK